MADEFGAGGPSWWESSTPSRNRFETVVSSSSSSSMTSIGSFGWLADMAGDGKAARPLLLDQPSPNISISSSGSGVSSLGFHHHQHQDPRKLSLGAESNSGSSLSETGLQMMNLGLSSQALDWNQQQPLLPSDNISSNNFQEENYLFHGVLGSADSQHQHSGFESRQVNNSYQNYAAAAAMNYVGHAGADHHYNHHHHPDHQQLNWSKVPQFLRVSSRKQPPQQSQAAAGGKGQLQFSNNAAFWNATTAAAAATDVKPSFFPPLQAQFPAPSSDEKPKNLLEMGDSSTVAKKTGGEVGNNKRPRNESAQSPLPPFKVKKEKMGDRITALQQLVSPFGKTDTASVLSETIVYIKFLHEQVSVLSTPYMKTGATQQPHHHHHHHHQHQNAEKPKLDAEGPRQDLRSRGLCLVPFASIFPMTSHDTSHDFWNPTFGGTFR
ncbi:hypothetical protein SAY86_004487 [Trapa natans]|uniref:BHLH domain-containing protein n=1 Tax=Trapa natans TaxID=22666 RepID=A0AAN7MYQ5_TRANT|nr:hypothetical protein SAY86_004487 [Trapa natans]